MSAVNDKPTEAERTAERKRVCAPIINTDHIVLSIKLSVHWKDLPVEVRALLMERLETFANDNQLFVTRMEGQTK